jgi:hypothetical protein
MSDFDIALAESKRRKKCAPLGKLLRSGYVPSESEWRRFDALNLAGPPSNSEAKAKRDEIRAQFLNDVLEEKRRRGRRWSSDNEVIIRALLPRHPGAIENRALRDLLKRPPEIVAIAKKLRPDLHPT